MLKLEDLNDGHFALLPMKYLLLERALGRFDKLLPKFHPLPSEYL